MHSGLMDSRLRNGHYRRSAGKQAFNLEGNLFENGKARTVEKTRGCPGIVCSRSEDTHLQAELCSRSLREGGRISFFTAPPNLIQEDVNVAVNRSAGSKTL